MGVSPHPAPKEQNSTDWEVLQLLDDPTREGRCTPLFRRFCGRGTHPFYFLFEGIRQQSHQPAVVRVVRVRVAPPARPSSPSHQREPAAVCCRVGERSEAAGCWGWDDRRCTARSADPSSPRPYTELRLRPTCFLRRDGGHPGEYSCCGQHDRWPSLHSHRGRPRTAE